MPPQLAPSHTAPPCGQTTSILERTANAPCPPGEAAAKTPPWRCKPPPSAASSNSSVETSAASPPYCSACTPIASAESSVHIDRRTISLSHGAGNGALSSPSDYPWPAPKNYWSEVQRNLRPVSQ